MPKAKNTKAERPFSFGFTEKAAAAVHLLRSCPDATFHKYCPDLSNDARSGFGADDILLGLFNAQHGDLK